MASSTRQIAPAETGGYGRNIVEAAEDFSRGGLQRASFSSRCPTVLRAKKTFRLRFVLFVPHPSFSAARLLRTSIVVHPRLPRAAKKPPFVNRRRINSKDVYLGTWRGSNWFTAQANAVYGSRNRQDRINRRIFKATNDGTVVADEMYDVHHTAVKQ